MKTAHITIFFISCLLLLNTNVFAQNKTEEKVIQKDSTNTKPTTFGLRLGTDVVKLVQTALDDNYSGFELNGDYRIYKNWFIAGELGSEQIDFVTDYLDVTSKGNYFKAGVDYNLHDNLFPLDNMIYSGFRVGYTSFSHTINEITSYNTQQYWQPTIVNTTNKEFSSLNAVWAEILMGIKAEVYKNLYLGVNMQLKYIVTADEPDNFANLNIPGIGKVFEDSKIGYGFSYSVSYRIPLYQK